MLVSLSRLGSVATHVITATQTDFISTLKSLSPVLTQLTAAGGNITEGLKIAGTFPFPLGDSLKAVHGDYANLNLYLDLNLQNELCGISARHLRRLFKETTDQTIYQYSRDIWAAKAKSMLSDTRAPVKEIASRLGFSDASSFSMAFRRATGEPPKVFRQQFRKPRVH